MKTNFHIGTFLFFLASVQFANAQTWDWGGNNTAGEWIGTNNGQPFPIRAGGAERIRVEAGGDVGIGTATPQNLLHLHLVGNTAVFQQFTNGTTGGASTNGLRIGITNNGIAEIRQQENNAMVFYTNGLERLRILNNGFVGIGNSTPTYALQVNGTIAAKQILVETSTETKDLLALITELQYEVEELKQKYRCLAETHFVTNETE